MRTRRYAGLWVLAGVCWSAASLRAAVPAVEDLSGCKLPNAIVVLPSPGTREAQRGELLKVSSGDFNPYPATAGGGAILTKAQAAERIRTDGLGDLQYLPDNGGSLWAVSGRISEIGFMYLSDAAGIKADPPMEIRATSRGAAGTYPGVDEGRTYLLQTTENKFALVRVLEKSPQFLVVQYVYQPTGAVSFEVPRGTLEDYHRPAAGRAPAATAPADVQTAGPTGAPAPTEPLVANATPTGGAIGHIELPSPAPKLPLGPNDIVSPGRIVLRDPAAAAGGGGGGAGGPGATPVSAADPGIDGFLKQRTQLVQRRISIVEAPANTPVEIEKKAQAIVDLANLHAEEAADALVHQITFLNTRTQSREFSIEALHPCLSALKRLGTAGSNAALHALSQLDPAAPGEGIDSPSYRAKLLGMVVRGVQGDETGEYILRREMERQSDPAHKALYVELLEAPKAR